MKNSNSLFYFPDPVKNTFYNQIYYDSQNKNHEICNQCYQTVGFYMTLVLVSILFIAFITIFRKSK